MYILLFSEIQSPKVHLNWGLTFGLYKTPIEGEELLLITKFEILNLLESMMSVIF